MNDNKRISVQTIKCDKAIVGVTKGKILYLRKEGSTKQGGDFFKITKDIGGGGSCECYEATLLGEKKNGRLKEFYPLDSIASKATFSLVRNEFNHIVATEETKEAFRVARNDFVESYHLLRNVMAENKKNADFTSFIPDFSIYYACDANGDFIENSTAYIWTAPQNLTVFEKYIEDIHRYPGAHPEHKLFTILKTTLTLTKCIKILHEKGLLHLDIKPSNFGIPQRKNELLTDSITLFDVNTIYSLKSAFTTGYGTPGFTAPEVTRGRADNTSDIYSIGCTLFSALIVSDEINKLGYSKEYYTKISKLIETSKLLSASETNSNLYLKHILTHVLKKCLAESPSRRYQSCEELAEDLKEALNYLYPSEIKSKLKPNQELVVMEKELDKKRGPGINLSLLYHLYKKPLFEHIEKESESIDVLIVGFGNYGQKFLDSCLQVGQVYGKKLNVNVISNNRINGAADKDIYLASRPELPNFFSIDGYTVTDEYGNITFTAKDFATGTGAIKKNQELATQIVAENGKTRYIFIALGDDQLNKNVAQAFIDATKNKFECSVNFAVEGEQITGKVYGNPVFMSKDITTEHEYQEIERMAFNAHLVWEDGLNIDMSKAWQNFKDPYNYNSSFSNAISVKYKLYSAGLIMDNLNEAASKYAEIVAIDEQQRNGMISLEHQRWNCEKICEGYTAISDLESCVDGPTRDKKAKKHICLVRSRADAPLQTPFWNHAKWDMAGSGDLSNLDELDQLSVKLHQIYKDHADEMRKSVSLFDDTMKRLKMIANKNVSSGIAFSEWFSALSLIWSGISTSVKEYKPLKANLIESLNALEVDDKNTAIALVEIIDKRFALILKSMEYTDWKDKDARLVDAIPFILTHKRNVHLAIPLSIGNNTRIFENVATPTVVNPSQVTYIYHFAHADDIADFDEAIKYIFNYLPEKNVSSKLNFVLSYRKDEAIASEIKKLKEVLDEKDFVQKVLPVEAENEFDIAQNIILTLDDKLHVDAIEQNSTPLSFLLVGAGVYREHPKYCFDISKKKFYDVVGCDYLKYIHAGQYLKVSDMFASKNSKGVIESPLAFYNDYDKLWKKAYRGQESVWKKTCRLLSKHHESDTIVTINFELLKEKGKIEKYRYLVPTGSFAGAKSIIDFMIEANVFEKESAIYYYTPDSCEINILASEFLKDKIKALFADPDLIVFYDHLLCKKTPYSVSVAYDYLKVSHFDLRSAGKHADRVKALLQLLESEFAFINGLTESSDDNQIVSFNYATTRIKKLLTNEGNILEVYIYLKCLKSGLFDDVATSYEVVWDGTPITSEFDVIITKGFASLLIEAKATEEIKQDFYFKLSSLANQFGTNAKAVLVADTIEKYFSVNVENNSMQRQRGDMLDVFTVSDAKDIDNIEKVLAKLLDIEMPQKVAPPSKVNNQVPIPVSKSESASNITMDSKIWVLNNPEFLEHSQVSILNNHGITTISQFLEQSEEDLENIKNSKGLSFKAKYLEVQKKLKKKMGIH